MLSQNPLSDSWYQYALHLAYLQSLNVDQHSCVIKFDHLLAICTQAFEQQTRYFHACGYSISSETVMSQFTSQSRLSIVTNNISNKDGITQFIHQFLINSVD